MGRIEPLKAWDEERVGSQIDLSADRKTATRQAETNPRGYGCLLYGKQQLGNYAEGRFAEVIIHQQGTRATESEYHAGGVCIGITKCKPADYKPEEVGRSIFHVPDSWVVDTYGDLYRVPPRNEWPPDTLNVAEKQPKSASVEKYDTYALVKDGDTLGLLLRPDKTLKLYWNGKHMADLPIEGFEVTQEVRLIVELLGRAEGATVNTEAKAPEIPLPPESSTEDEGGK
ncbi:unnamed protein product [Amoebophrya sp. A120]|nr:unnamed protein product [Amoebophrya sp. A120]|eukprot:GSA120T00022300001.1